MTRLQELARLTPARADVRRFETAAAALWGSITGARSRAEEREALARVAAAMHGIRLCATGQVRDDAELLWELCWTRLGANTAKTDREAA